MWWTQGLHLYHTKRDFVEAKVFYREHAPCLPPATVLGNVVDTRPSPLPHKKRLCWTKGILQGACPLLTPSHSFITCDSDSILQGACLLLTPSHSFRKCGGHKAFTSTTIYKKCGEKTSSGGRAGTPHPERNMELWYTVCNYCMDNKKKKLKK